MNTIINPTESSLRDRGSKFYGYLFPCQNEAEFTEELNLLKSKYPDANHHCYGYRIDPNNVTEFSSDDGEPSGTAGLPILNQLRSFDVVNAGLVVVRYFGGTKLGKPGLIQAYGDTAQHSLSEASLKAIKLVQLFHISYPYSEELLFNKISSDFELTEQSAEYTDIVEKTIACPVQNANAFNKYHETVKHRGIKLEELAKTFIAV